MELVIKQWSVSSTPDDSGEYVRIHGREAGLLRFLLSLVGIDPTTTLAVDARSVRFEQGSLAGFEKRVTPLTSVSTASYGYFKPWIAAIIIAGWGVAMLVFIPMVFIPVIGWVIGLLFLILAPIFYLLNTQFFLRIVDHSGGKPIQIIFKRSVIEGKSIDQDSGEQIVGIIEMLLLGLSAPRAARANMSGAGVSTEVDAISERARQRMENLKLQAMRAGERVASKAAASLAAASGSATVADAKCPGCGGTISAHDAFCGSCGYKLHA